MRQRMPVHRTGANRELARPLARTRSISSPVYRETGNRGMGVGIVAYLGAICVIGWFVITYGGSSGDANADALQVASPPAPAPTVASTVAPPAYVEADDEFMPGEGAQTSEYWASRADSAIPPSQDPLTRQHY